MFLWVAVLAVPLLGERLGPLPVAALVLLLTGTVMLAPAGSIGSGAGELMILAATWCWAVEVVIARWLLRGSVPASAAAAARMTIGSLTLFVIAGSSGGLGGVAAYGAEQWTAIAITGALLSRLRPHLVRGAPAGTGHDRHECPRRRRGHHDRLQVITNGTAPTAPSLIGNFLLVGGCAAAIVAARIALGRTALGAASTARWSST